MDGDVDSTDQSLFNAAGYKAALAVGVVSDRTGPDNPFGYASYLHRPETGHYLARNRHYDPVAGRWISRDPIGYADGFNLYEYVSSGPARYTDPFGLQKAPDSNGTGEGCDAWLEKLDNLSKAVIKNCQGFVVSEGTVSNLIKAGMGAGGAGGIGIQYGYNGLATGSRNLANASRSRAISDGLTPGAVRNAGRGFIDGETRARWKSFRVGLAGASLSGVGGILDAAGTIQAYHHGDMDGVRNGAAASILGFAGMVPGPIGIVATVGQLGVAGIISVHERIVLDPAIDAENKSRAKTCNMQQTALNTHIQKQPPGCSTCK